MEYAKSKLLGELFDSFIEEMGWKVKYLGPEDRPNLTNSKNASIIDSKWRNSFLAKQADKYDK